MDRLGRVSNGRMLYLRVGIAEIYEVRPCKFVCFTSLVNLCESDTLMLMVKYDHRKRMVLYRRRKWLRVGLVGLTLVTVCGLSYEGFGIYRDIMGNDWTPTTRKFKNYDRVKIAKSGRAAYSGMADEFKRQGFDISSAYKTSEVDVCYGSSRGAGSNTIGYDKNCYYRRTAIFVSDDDYASTAKQKIEQLKSLSHGDIKVVLSHAPCESFATGMAQRFSIDFHVCPATKNTVKLSSYYHAYNAEKYPYATYEIRGPFDNAGGELSNLKEVNYQLLTHNFYNFPDTVQSLAHKGHGSFVMVGITDHYYYGRPQ